VGTRADAGGRLLLFGFRMASGSDDFGRVPRNAADGRNCLIARPALLGNLLADHGAAASFPEAVPENEEVVPVNAVSTWVLPSGVTVGR
jgi:hypothetical protein